MSQPQRPHNSRNPLADAPSDCVCCVCRCDLVNRKQVEYATAKDYADRMDMSFIEASAKASTNVEKVTHTHTHTHRAQHSRTAHAAIHAVRGG